MTTGHEAVSIRPFVASDRDALDAMLRRSWHDAYDPLLGPAKVDEKLDGLRASLRWTMWLPALDPGFLVARAEDRLVGAIWYRRQLIGRSVFVSMLYVDPSFQGRGLGSVLIGECIDRCPNVRHLFVEVLEGNFAALRFYQSRGFHQISAGRGRYSNERVITLRLDVCRS